jgi:predicted negative regulator of RcsB-dependent stress response
LTAAKVQFAKGQADVAKASLAWVAENAVEDELKTVARLRLAGLQLDARQFDEALKSLDAAQSVDFEALVQDRRGDVYLAQGQLAQARAAYQRAWLALSDKADYRRLVDAKLTALGASPEAPAAAASGGAATATAVTPAVAGTAASAASGTRP